MILWLDLKMVEEMQLKMNLLLILYLKDIWESWENKVPVVYQNNRVDLGYDLNNLLGQYKLYRDSKEGSRNIGAVVPVNTVISWHRVLKTKLRTLNSQKKSN